MSINNVTIFSDASYSAEKRSAGGAFWARGDEIRLSGNFELPLATCSGTAEVLAAQYGIIQLLSHDGFKAEFDKGRETRLVLVIDCTAVKDVFERDHHVFVENAEVARCLKLIRKAQRDQGWFFKINHVKAHNGTRTARSWVNDWCDTKSREARLLMESRRYQ